MAYPFDYDVAGDYFGDLADLLVLTVTGITDLGAGQYRFAIDAADQPALARVSPNTVFTHTNPTANGVVEVVKVQAKDATSLTATRAQEGTTSLAYAPGAVLLQEPTAGLYEAMRTLLLATEKYTGLVGSSLPATCQPGEFFLLTNGQFYACYTANIWTRLDYFDHGALTGLGAADAHTIYLTPAEEQAWHDALPGDHLSNPATHNHSGGAMGAPVRKFSCGNESEMPAAQNAGDCYFALDTKRLYFSADGASWSAYSSLPTGSVLMFEGSCPTGWVRVAEMDGKIPRGAPASEWQNLDSASANATHTHTLPTLLAHTHSFNSKSCTVSVTGSHSHTIDIFNGSGSTLYPNNPMNASSTGTLSSSTDGEHSHSVSFPQVDTTQVGVDAPVTAAQTSLPPYLKLLFCRKA